MKSLRFFFYSMLLLACSCQKVDLPVSKGSFIFDTAPFDSCHASTVLEVNDELLCAFFAGKEEGAKGTGIWLSRYKEGFWSAPIEVASDEQPCWNPVLTTLSNEVLLFYKVGPNPERWSGALKRSLDGGKKWGKEEPLPAGIFGPIKNKPLFKDGELLCGSSVESYKRWGCFIEKTKDGKSWERSSPINLKGNYDGIIQPALVDLGDDNLLLFARTRGLGYLAKSTSSDGGKTWEEATLTEVKSSNTGADAIALQDGRILLVHNASKTERTPLAVAISEDKGKSFKDVLILEEGEGEFSYPAVIQKKDGEIVVTYTWNREKIKVAMFSPESFKE